MRVSVVVPLFNKGPWVERCLRSIQAQSGPEFETIVVDDGSTDNGAAAAEAFAGPSLRVIRQANAGPGAARNRGIAEASADLIAFLDADDEYLPGFLAEAVAALDRHTEAASVTFGYREFPAGVSREPMWRSRGVSSGVYRVGPTTDPAWLVHALAFMSPCSTVARAAHVRRWGGFHENRCRYGEDAMLWLKVLLNSPVVFDPRPFSAFHFEASALSSNLPSMRPVEPFLTDPGEIYAACPAAHRELLDRFLARRATKTATLLGLWGRPAEARRLVARFVTSRDWRAPWLIPALIGATPIAPAAGALLRPVLSRR